MQWIQHHHYNNCPDSDGNNNANSSGSGDGNGKGGGGHGDGGDNDDGNNSSTVATSNDFQYTTLSKMTAAYACTGNPYLWIPSQPLALMCCSL